MSTPARTDFFWAVFIQVDLSDGSTMRLSFEPFVNLLMSYEEHAHKDIQTHVCTGIYYIYIHNHTYFDIELPYGILILVFFASNAMMMPILIHKHFLGAWLNITAVLRNALKKTGAKKG